jgi:hypothetical protein
MASPQAIKKRLRGKRARARQRPHGRDLRGQYREADLPQAGHLAVEVIENPYSEAGRIDREGNLDVRARLEPAHHSDGSIAEGAPGWTPPRRPLVTVVRALRDDPLGRMFSRHQIDQPQYLGGRSYQELVEVVQIGSMRSVDLGKTPVSGGRFIEPLTDTRQRAARRLRSVEGAVVHHHGVEGLGLARAVLADRRSVEATARQYGAASNREVRSVAWLFRKILDVIAKACGFATTTHRLPPVAKLDEAGAPDASDPGMHADACELSCADLRHGRANGHDR